jgi:UDP-N-acetylmuramyl pentapeptide phosphotransferase/UDP-N-acetylglucosamine-1-phosphate transferase
MPTFESFYHLLFGFLVSVFCVGFLASRRASLLGLGLDKQSGVQKMHTAPTSRLGGVGIFVGLCVGVFLSKDIYLSDAILGFCLLVGSLPVFASGLIEDLTHKVHPTTRLLMASLSSLLILWILHVGVERTNIPPLDFLLNLPFFMTLLTILVVSGFTNAINIIDGFHGLASGSVMIMLAGLAVLSFMVSDWTVLRLCLLTLVVILGFWVWNWPFGKIFLGDAGAYLIGFCVVELGLLIPHRSPEISPMAPVLIGIYPLIETVFSMYRRKFVRTHPLNHPDALHLHTMLYRRLFAPKGNADASLQMKNFSNAKVSVFLWFLTLVPTVFACVFLSNTPVLLLCMALFALVYSILYKSLVEFKIQKWLRFRP